MTIQIWPVKNGNIVEETQIYTGPLGDGSIYIQYRINGTDLEVLYSHTGPETRPYPSGWVVYASQNAEMPSGWETYKEDSQRAADIKKVLDGTHLWKPDLGAEAIERSATVISDATVTIQL
jgi:hypothetical protein